MWEEADLTERRKLLLAMLDAVYVDTVEEKSVVAIRPKPAFRPLLEMATTSAGSGIVPINETPPGPEGPEAESLCSWWRRGRVKLHLEHHLAVLVATVWGISGESIVGYSPGYCEPSFTFLRPQYL